MLWHPLQPGVHATAGRTEIGGAWVDLTPDNRVVVSAELQDPVLPDTQMTADEEDARVKDCLDTMVALFTAARKYKPDRDAKWLELLFQAMEVAEGDGVSKDDIRAAWEQHGPQQCLPSGSGPEADDEEDCPSGGDKGSPSTADEATVTVSSADKGSGGEEEEFDPGPAARKQQKEQPSPIRTSARRWGAKSSDPAAAMQGALGEGAAGGSEGQAGAANAGKRSGAGQDDKEADGADMGVSDGGTGEAQRTE